QVPTGTYLDMAANLPLVDPKKVLSPVLMIRGIHDGNSTTEDLIDFFRQLPNGDRQFVILPHTAHSPRYSNNRHLLWYAPRNFLAAPAAVATSLANLPSSVAVLVRSTASRLKQLDEIAGGVLQQDLRSAWPGHDVVAELDAGGAQPRDLGRNIIHDEMNAVPAAGTGAIAIGHRSSGRAFRPAEQEPQRPQGDVGKSRRCVGEKLEAEVFGVPRDRRVDIVDHVADIDGRYRCCRHSLLPQLNASM